MASVNLPFHGNKFPDSILWDPGNTNHGDPQASCVSLSLANKHFELCNMLGFNGDAKFGAGRGLGDTVPALRFNNSLEGLMEF